MMKRLLLLTAVLLAAPAVSAQTDFEFDTVFPADTIDAGSMHGVAVDAEGDVWLQPFGGTFPFVFPDSVEIGSSTFKELNIRQIFVYNADGTGQDTLTYLTGAIQDTLGLYKIGVNATNGRDIYDTRSGRGMRYCVGNNSVYISQFDTIYKINATSNEAEAKLIPYPGNSLGQVGVDDECNVYTVPVVPGAGPVRVYGPDLDPSSVVTVADASSNFSRSITASPDGLTVFETDYENDFTIVHQRADEFSDFSVSDSTFFGMRTESAAFQPNSGYYQVLWASAGNPLNPPNDSTYDYRWSQNTWYAFRLSDVIGEDGTTINRQPMPVDSLKIDNPEDGRPRGIAFSQDGMTAYVVQFNKAGSVQKLVAMGVDVEQGPGEAEEFALGQNRPNPFSNGTTIPFSVETPGRVALRVFDVTGRQVAVLTDRDYEPGNYTATFDAAELAAGTYIYALDVDGRQISRRMLVVR